MLAYPAGVIPVAGTHEGWMTAPPLKIGATHLKSNLTWTLSLPDAFK